MNVKFKFWASPVDHADVVAWVTLTRYTDLANNSDKYRRFITVHAPGWLPYSFTHTGRWTAQTARGDWSGGTVRPGQLASHASWRRSGTDSAQWHDTRVKTKQGNYHGTGTSRMSWADLQALANRAQLFDSGPVTPVTPMKVTLLPTDAASGPAASNNLDMLQKQLSNLLDKARDNDVDTFDLFADFAMLKGSVSTEIELHTRIAEELTAKLALVSQVIVERD